jgi:hypothetical protein
MTAHQKTRLTRGSTRALLTPLFGDEEWAMPLHGIAAARPLGDADFADLPIPKQVWDG